MPNFSLNFDTKLRGICASAPKNNRLNQSEQLVVKSAAKCGSIARAPTSNRCILLSGCATCTPHRTLFAFGTMNIVLVCLKIKSDYFWRIDPCVD
jgi:hypothetical protein